MELEDADGSGGCCWKWKMLMEDGRRTASWAYEEPFKVC